MKTTKHGLSEKETELVRLLMADCEITGDIQSKLKKLFAGTIEQMLDEQSGIISTKTKHFSKYMIIDKAKWFEVWQKNLHYVSYGAVTYDTVLALDCSGSMYDNDPITQRTHVVEIYPGHYVTVTDKTCGRIVASENYVSTMQSIMVS